jgi:hypothetical protein
MRSLLYNSLIDIKRHDKLVTHYLFNKLDCIRHVQLVAFHIVYRASPEENIISEQWYAETQDLAVSRSGVD